MDAWLYKVLKDALSLHEINDQQAKQLLKRLICVIFPDKKQTHEISQNEGEKNGTDRTNRES